MNLTFLLRRISELKLTTEGLAESCGVSEGYMSNQILKGLVPSKSVLKCLAFTLQCSERDLVAESAGSIAAAG